MKELWNCFVVLGWLGGGALAIQILLNCMARWPLAPSYKRIKK